MDQERIDIPFIPTDAEPEPDPTQYDPVDYGTAETPPNPGTPSGPGIKASEGGTNAHRVVLFDVRYTYHPGHVVVPPAGSDEEASQVVKMHAAFWIKEVTWTIERDNEVPILPHPEGDVNEVPMPGTWIQPADPLEGPQGSRVYRVSGFYRFQLVRAPFSFQQWGPFPTAVGPHTTATQQDNTIPAEAFQRGMIGNSNGYSKVF